MELLCKFTWQRSCRWDRGVKRTVWRHIKAGKVTVNTAEQFAKVAQTQYPNVQIRFISKEDIEKGSESLQMKWKSALPVPNIHSVHCVKPSSNNHVQISDISRALHVKIVPIFPISEDSKSSDSKDEAYETIQERYFCLTKLQGKKTEIFFVAEIIDVNKQQYCVKYLKKIAHSN